MKHLNGFFDINLDDIIEIDNGYGVEGASDSVTIEFENNKFKGATIWYMHFIRETECESDWDIDENEARQIVMKSLEIKHE